MIPRGTSKLLYASNSLHFPQSLAPAAFMTVFMACLEVAILKARDLISFYRSHLLYPHSQLGLNEVVN